MDATFERRTMRVSVCVYDGDVSETMSEGKWQPVLSLPAKSCFSLSSTPHRVSHADLIIIMCVCIANTERQEEARTSIVSQKDW